MAVTIRTRKPLGLDPLLVSALALCPALAAASGLREALLLASGLATVTCGSIALLTPLRRFVLPQFALLPIVTIAGGWTALWTMFAYALFPALFSTIALYAYLTPAMLPVVWIALWLEPDPAKTVRIPDIFLTPLYAGIGLCFVAALREIIGAGTIFELPVVAKPPLAWARTTSGALAIAAFVTGCGALRESLRCPARKEEAQ